MWLRSAKILRKVLETWGHLNCNEKPPAYTGVKNSHDINYNHWLCQRTKKSIEHEVDSDTNCKWCTWTVSKDLVKVMEVLEYGRWAKTNQTTAFFRSARILRKVLETWGDLLLLKLKWKIISQHWSENLQGIQPDQLISARRPNLIIINKKKKRNLQNCGLCCPSWQQNKTERMGKEG